MRQGSWYRQHSRGSTHQAKSKLTVSRAGVAASALQVVARRIEPQAKRSIVAVLVRRGRQWSRVRRVFPGEALHRVDGRIRDAPAAGAGPGTGAISQPALNAAMPLYYGSLTAFF